MSNNKKANNTRTGLILFTVALVFFVGVIVKQSFFR
ncbi:cytochrome oxidase small assembly protein [Undibacterium sp. RTI2.1]|nr:MULTISPECIES: cytochrome oxidase small assembly protein [unclassified Undibacterium]MDY7540087.1 cytochrome oxidase small assembly protein [Undibacterium sp. 5I1]MEB0031722.1 cytochrome oxidase small assembly protein [Undibacterium sp. RTI2.1]MEB0118026.1 cytochrome oxidase small assembly protein [Undibacterium sp. RTI2.2]MEB0231802.1 cytochrome oxidase small assembly protein [Undibacterium sp. 10I3]MEB0259189.1 cytochrome oxidase small assembly protein [Undibacterium sp. 5I1]